MVQILRSQRANISSELLWTIEMAWHGHLYGDNEHEGLLSQLKKRVSCLKRLSKYMSKEALNGPYRDKYEVHVLQNNVNGLITWARYWTCLMTGTRYWTCLITGARYWTSTAELNHRQSVWNAAPYGHDSQESNQHREAKISGKKITECRRRAWGRTHYHMA